MNGDEFEVVEEMERRGGGFVRSLAEAFKRADEHNFRRLRSAFADYWSDYGGSSPRLLPRNNLFGVAGEFAGAGVRVRVRGMGSIAMKQNAGGLSEDEALNLAAYLVEACGPGARERFDAAYVRASDG